MKLNQSEAKINRNKYNKIGLSGIDRLKKDIMRLKSDWDCAQTQARVMQLWIYKLADRRGSRRCSICAVLQLICAFDFSHLQKAGFLATCLN